MRKVAKQVICAIIKYEKRAMREHASLNKCKHHLRWCQPLYDFIKNHEAGQAYAWFLFFVIFAVHDRYD